MREKEQMFDKAIKDKDTMNLKIAVVSCLLFVTSRNLKTSGLKVRLFSWKTEGSKVESGKRGGYELILKSGNFYVF